MFKPTPMIPHSFTPIEINQTPKPQKMYSEEDILLLIKFIVKEFAQIVQTWISRPNVGTPFFNLNSMPQGSMNSMLLSALLARETVNLQNQEMIQSQLIQQVNSILLADMFDQNKNISDESSPIDRSKNISIASFPQAASLVPDMKQNVDFEASPKFPTRPELQTKDEIDTIQSSDDKTNRIRTISEEQNEISVPKIGLHEAYSILENNKALNSLIKTVSSTLN